jgi:phage shock protein PspC (stress-responsive transcriptional regulator)
MPRADIIRFLVMALSMLAVGVAAYWIASVILG